MQRLRLLHRDRRSGGGTGQRRVDVPDRPRWQMTRRAFDTNANSVCLARYLILARRIESENDADHTRLELTIMHVDDPATRRMIVRLAARQTETGPRDVDDDAVGTAKRQVTRRHV